MNSSEGYIILSPSKPKPKRLWLILLVLLLLLATGLGLWFLFAKPFNSDRPADQTTTYQNPGPEEIYVVTIGPEDKEPKVQLIDLNAKVHPVDKNTKRDTIGSNGWLPRECRNVVFRRYQRDLDGCSEKLKEKPEFELGFFDDLAEPLDVFFSNEERLKEEIDLVGVYSLNGRILIAILENFNSDKEKYASLLELKAGALIRVAKFPEQHILWLGLKERTNE